MLGRLWICVALALCACGGVRPSFDEAPRVTTSVQVTDSESCRVEAALQDLMAEGLGSVSFHANAASMLRVQVRLVESAGGWRGNIEVRDRDGARLGQRSLDLATGSCEDARASVGFVLAMLVETPAVAQAVEEAAVEEAQPEPSERVFRLGLVGGASMGRTPSLAGFVGVSGALSWPQFDLRLSARALLPGEEGSPRFRAWGAELALQACPTLSLGRRSLGALGFCGGVRGGFVRSEGVDLMPNIGASGGMLDGTLSLRPAFRSGRLEVGLELLGGVSIVRPVFAFQRGEEVTTVYEPSRVWAELGLFVSVSL